MDGIRVGLTTKIYPGESIDKLNVSRDFPWLDPNSQQAEDVERFRWFSQGFVALSPINASRIIDVRYSMLPDEIKGLWMIELDSTLAPNEHVRYLHLVQGQHPHQDKDKDKDKSQNQGQDQNSNENQNAITNRLWDMIRGR